MFHLIDGCPVHLRQSILCLNNEKKIHAVPTEIGREFW